ncbi:MAG: M28 family peptidase [Euryarchaeota archaeon]|nr:M28 family peptidase [Euryarchaeota archaeon]
MRLTVPFAALALATLAFAGCLEESKEASLPHAGGAATIVYEAPVLPKVDVKAFLVEHAKFVTKNPYRANNADGHKGARDYIAAQFNASGLEVWRQSFTSGIPQENVCGLKIGAVRPTEWVVVGGHYDTTTWDDGVGRGQTSHRVSQGAYDDGSGTWMTVEIAKAVSKIPSYYSIAFCAFDGEERGLQGSRAVYNAMKEDGKFPYEVNSTRAMLDFDMFGICWPVRAPIYLDTNNQILTDKIQAFRKDLKIPDEMFKKKGLTLGQSDYAHWYRDPSVATAFFISDFEELGVPTPVPNPAPVPGVPGAYPFWHLSDTVETMTVMAGGPSMLEAGFQTALTLGMQTLNAMAFDPTADFGTAKA